MEYNWGDFHHVDYLTFEHAGLRFEYGHSSLTDNYRICHPMDCLAVLEPEGGLVEDGCTEARTLPAVCVEILPDGTHAELVDYFVSCEHKLDDPAFWCEYTGGAIVDRECCATQSDFPGYCNYDPCTCAPEDSVSIQACECPVGTCFNGIDCIAEPSI